jgi:hypothetical protein
MNVEETKPQTTNVSKFVAYLLRHAPDEYDIHLDTHGWVSGKTVLNAIRTKYPNRNQTARGLLTNVLEADDNHRFQTKESFVRATHKHSVSHVQMPEKDPRSVDRDKLSWYHVEYKNSRKSDYVEGENKEQVKSVLKYRISPETPIKHISQTERTQISEETLKAGPPYKKIHQDPRKPLIEEVRFNMGGHKGLYITTQPDWV